MANPHNRREIRAADLFSSHSITYILKIAANSWPLDVTGMFLFTETLKIVKLKNNEKNRPLHLHYFWHNLREKLAYHGLYHIYYVF